MRFVICYISAGFFSAPKGAVPTGMNLFQLLTKIALVAVIPAVLLAGECDQTVVHAPFNFGNSFDAYTRGERPTLDKLVGKRWTLTGVAAPKRQITLGSAYDPTGYEVDGKVPVLRFASRVQTPEVPEWSDQPYFAWWEERFGGAVDLPQAAHQPLWSGTHALKRESVSFAFALWGDDGDLVAVAPGLEKRRGQAFCRLVSGELLCMIEKFGGRPEALQTTGVSAFLLFQPR